MDKEKIIVILKSYFQDKAGFYNIEMAFLYGSWASGYPKKESDIDIAVMFSCEMGKEKMFDIINSMSLELSNILKKDISIIHIDRELSKPMLHYNAIVHGEPVFVRDFTRYVDVRLKAIFQMEDFSIFGLKWQDEIVKKRMEMISHA